MYALIGLEQISSLLILVHHPRTPYQLIVLARGISIISFEFVPNLVTMLYSEDTGYNALSDSSQYHCSLSGRIFLINTGNTISMAFFMLVAYLLVIPLSWYLNLAKRVRRAFEWGMFLDLARTSMFDFCLSGFVQLRDVPLLCEICGSRSSRATPTSSSPAASPT